MSCRSTKHVRTARRRLGCAFTAILLSAGCNDADSADSASELDAAADAATRLDAGTLLDARTLDAAVGAPFAKLLENRGWSRYDASLDPLPSHQPAQIDCPETASYVEYGSLEVDTTRCNYLLAETAALLALPVGSDVRLSLLHYDLLAPLPASAHVALFFGDSLQWETLIPIPAPGDAVKASFQTTRALALGDPIRLHLHNHGGNAYLLVSVEASPRVP
jgi:hypothetical protein